MHHSTEMRCDHVEKSNGISKKSNEPDVPGQGDLQAFETGWIDENVACVREWVANIFFYRKGDRDARADLEANAPIEKHRTADTGVPLQSYRLCRDRGQSVHASAVAA